ncbi:MAG: serine/threonine protein kinase [Myxococcales bacterium]|nr:serine/threonine protein kinase [Myxococcales bacterium]MCB9709248.1 serine/threonine protein kinase [Myxococcales bacterium]
MTGASVRPNPTDRRKVVGQRLGRYDVLYLLASGGMGSVYVGRQSGMAGFERLVAIKTLHPHLAEEDQFVNMFLDEARLAARIRHPNVVATLDISESPLDGYFLVMEYVEGENLAALLKRSVMSGSHLPVTIALRIVLDALQGLAAAHSLTERDGKRLNLVHRDVSPQNVLVGADGISRLTDFGIAKAEVNVSTTRHGQLKGKLSYMAPEQATHGRVEQRSDLFSMGIVLWEALTQKRLFRGKTNAETLHKVLISDAPSPSSVRKDLAPFDNVLKRALARAVEERFQTAQEMIEAIERVAPQVGGVAPARAVSLLVEKLSKDKLSQEARAINDALRGIPRDPGVPIAIPIDIDEEGRTPVTDSSVLIRSDESGSDRASSRRGASPWLWGFLVLGVLGLGVIATMWFSRPHQVAAPPKRETAKQSSAPPTRPPEVAPPGEVVTPAVPTVLEPKAQEPEAAPPAPEEPTATPPPAPTRVRRVIRRQPKAKRPSSNAEVLSNPYR